VTRRRLDALVDAVGGGRGRLAALVHLPGGIGRDLAHRGHVAHRGADIVGGDVAAAERMNETGHRRDQGRGLVPRRIADDDRLAAAEGQPGQRRLVGHAARQPQHVAQRLVLGGVGKHPAAAEGRAQPGVVDGDDGPQPAGRIVAENHLFVIDEIDRAKHRHGRPPWFDLVR
jgi:hypothetical protein